METRNYQDNAQLDLRIIHFSCAFFLFTQNFVLVRIIAQMPDRDHGLLITVLLCGFQVCRRVGRARAVNGRPAPENPCWPFPLRVTARLPAQPFGPAL